MELRPLGPAQMDFYYQEPIWPEPPPGMMPEVAPPAMPTGPFGVSRGGARSFPPELVYGTNEPITLDNINNFYDPLPPGSNPSDYLMTPPSGGGAMEPGPPPVMPGGGGMNPLGMLGRIAGAPMNFLKHVWNDGLFNKPDIFLDPTDQMISEATGGYPSLTRDDIKYGQQMPQAGSPDVQGASRTGPQGQGGMYASNGSIGNPMRDFVRRQFMESMQRNAGIMRGNNDLMEQLQKQALLEQRWGGIGSAIGGVKGLFGKSDGGGYTRSGKRIPGYWENFSNQRMDSAKDAYRGLAQVSRLRQNAQNNLFEMDQMLDPNSWRNKRADAYAQRADTYSKTQPYKAQTGRMRAENQDAHYRRSDESKDNYRKGQLSILDRREKRLQKSTESLISLRNQRRIALENGDERKAQELDLKIQKFEYQQRYDKDRLGIAQQNANTASSNAATSSRRADIYSDSVANQNANRDRRTDSYVNYRNIMGDSRIKRDNMARDKQALDVLRSKGSRVKSGFTGELQHKYDADTRGQMGNLVNSITGNPDGRQRFDYEARAQADPVFRNMRDFFADARRRGLSKAQAIKEWKDAQRR